MPKLKRALLAVSLLAAQGLLSHASPANSRLLTLIPAGVNLVAGVEDPHNQNTNGHHLLVTVANSVELDDWLALTGVDNHRSVEQIIWLASSSTRGPLKEHALLVSGRFDRDHIFRAAKQNGSSSTWYGGVESLVIQPLPRDSGRIGETRWLTILDGQAAVFGTPWFVQKIIDRYAAHTPADPELVRYVGQLRGNTNSWTILALDGDPTARAFATQHLPSPWTELLQPATVLISGIRYGGTTHIDFSIQLPPDRISPHTQPADALPTLLTDGWLESAHARIESFSVASGQITGTLALPQTQFDAYFHSRAWDASRPLTASAK